MDSLLDWQHSYRLNVILLSTIGLWPLDNRRFLRLKRFVGTFFAFICCFSQLATFSTVHYTKGLFMRNVPCIFVGCGVLVKYIAFLAGGNGIKRITETINNDWKNVSSKEELRIIEKYIKKGKFHTKGFAMFICPAAISLLLAPLSSTFLDIIMPLNESRSRVFPIMFEVFIDQKKHSFLGSFVFDGGIVVGALVFVSTETLFIVYVQHACALFEVTSRRIKKLLYVIEPRNSKRSINAAVIIQMVDIHSRAIRLLAHKRHLYSYNDERVPTSLSIIIPFCLIVKFKERFSLSYLFLLTFGILSLGAYLFHCTQSIATNELTDFITSGFFCLAILGYMFYLNFVSQRVLDLSGDLFDDLYETEWYKFPASTRKLVLFCMLNSTKPTIIDLYSIFVPSYEGFSVIVKMTMSYATALYSFQV